MDNSLNLETLLHQAVEKNATDLHMTVGIPPQLRINGELTFTDFPPLKIEEIQKRF